MRLRPGLCPGPRWGSSRRSPNLLGGWGEALPRTPLVSLDGTFGTSTHCPGTNYEKSAPMSIKH